MTALCDLIAAGLIEKDKHGDLLWIWSYPSVTKEQRELFLKKCQFSSECSSESMEASVFYGQLRKQWYYIITEQVESSTIPKVTHIALVLIAQDFNPEKYEALGKILNKLYSKTGNPSHMLSSYLAVVTRGICNGEENGSFAVKDFDIRQAYVAASIKDVIKKFGIEIILIYTALLLKKRVAAYHSALPQLLSCVRALPALVWHRQNWNILFPHVALEDTELADLRSARTYVAGFTDASIESRLDYYDVFVNASSGEITVAPHARESLTMGKLHKELAQSICQYAEDDSKTEQQVIKEIALKTKELLNNLRSLSSSEDSSNPYITLEMLKQRKMPAAAENFLFSLAAAEGLVKT